MALILSINQGDKTEKNIKTTPSPPSLPPSPSITIVRSREYDLLNTRLISHDKANKTLTCKHKFFLKIFWNLSKYFTTHRMIYYVGVETMQM